MQYRKDRRGNDLSVLGYGCMRFTRKGTGIDLEKAERELMHAIRLGVNYLDTAYIYPGRRGNPAEKRLPGQGISCDKAAALSDQIHGRH